MSKYYSETLGIDFKMSDEDFCNYIQSCTDEQREAIIGMAITYSIGSDDYIMYIREVSKDGKLIKICENMDDDETYQKQSRKKDKVHIIYNWEHWFLRTRNSNKKYLKRRIRDGRNLTYEKAIEFLSSPKYDKKFQEYGHLYFNEAIEYRDPCF